MAPRGCGGGGERGCSTSYSHQDSPHYQAYPGPTSIALSSPKRFLEWKQQDINTE